EPGAAIPLAGPFRYIGATRKGMHKYATDIPVRPRGLFFNKPQAGLSLATRDGTPVRYDRFGKSEQPTWGHDRTELVLYFPDTSREPGAGEFVLTDTRAEDRERALNLRWSGEPAEQFAWTTIQEGWDNRRGLLVPAPARAAWDVQIPASGELRFVAGLVEPEIKVGAASDGATVRVEVDADGATTEVLRVPVALHAFDSQRVDLSRWAGKKVRLRIATDPGASTDYDYVFVGEPILTSRKANPTRVVMVFLDTLRPDHMSLYGYGRDTSAAIDPLVDEAAVFDAARSVAPWTLPSSRTLVTGRQPEDYGVAQTLPGILHDRGFATGMIAGNVYLSVNFQMERDWDFHRVGLWPPANEATDEALAWLADHEGQDVLLQLHFMSNHLPYVEPEPYRHKYATDTTPPLRDGFLLSDVRQGNVGSDPEAQQYVTDRYDNNVAFATDQVARLLEALDQDDIVVIFADHGEELWDHQGFEHGHTLYDELLRVPLILRAPGVPAGRIAAPVSLLDLTPTLLDLVGAPLPSDLDGRSLLPLVRGEPGAAEAFGARDQAFGRPLYGSERWGVLHGSSKWTTTEGKEALFDVAADPDEKKNALKGDAGGASAEYRDYLQGALGRPVGAGYRLQPTNHKGGKNIPGLWALCTVPGGFSEAWKADDPLENSEATVHTLSDPAEIARRLATYGITDHAVGPDDGAVEVCWHAGLYGSREVYTVPARPLDQVGRQMVCSAYYGDGSGGHSGTSRIPADRDPTLAGGRSLPLAKLALDARQLAWGFGIAPIPAADTMPLEGRDAEADEMLAGLGYVDPEKPDGEPAGPAQTDGRCVPPAPSTQGTSP
ncbi:MAG: sulfatase, partial [Myxococcota bacterium]